MELLEAATLRSIGRSWQAGATADCGHGLIGNTVELDEVMDEHADDLLSDVTAGEENFLSLRGPLSCCTAAHTETDICTS